MTTIYHSLLLEEKFLAQLKKELSKYFKGCKKVAIKMHFGELGNSKAFKPSDIQPILNVLTELKIDYFLYDSSVMYGGPRSNTVTHKALAVAKGFKNVDLGDEFIEVKGKNLIYQVCKMLTDADAVLVLTHVKGHACTGFGGAIKNLGMGALSKQTKTDIHKGGEPIFNDKCIKCGACIKCCPINGLIQKDSESHPTIKTCYGCSNCFYICPHKAISVKVAPFDELLADGANSAQSKFKKYYYVSMVNNIAKDCDCMSMPGDIIAKDAGWLMSPNGVAIDQAAYDLIVKIDGQVFLKHNKKKGTRQIDDAEKLGMGSKKYVLKEL
ncbi:MAG: DUF362 domain-containing protein [Candidatus Woesearchaeota archaeon]